MLFGPSVKVFYRVFATRVHECLIMNPLPMHKKYSAEARRREISRGLVRIFSQSQVINEVCCAEAALAQCLQDSN